MNANPAQYDDAAVTAEIHEMIAQMERDTVRIEVFGGLCVLEFVPDIYCGKGPGVGFTMMATTNRMIGPFDGQWHAGMGAISLDGARRLRDMLSKFIAKTETETE